MILQYCINNVGDAIVMMGESWQVLSSDLAADKDLNAFISMFYIKIPHYIPEFLN